MVQNKSKERFIINPEAYNDLSYLELKDKLRWCKGKLVRAAHELSNIEDIIRLNENPPASVVHSRLELTNSVRELAARIKLLQSNINRMEVRM